MTDKEPIIIDGVDVSKCKYLPYCNDKQGNCAFEPNCYFKQLARKTQECEELKEENDRYSKALEEIEGIVIKDYYDNNWADIAMKIDSIRNIINKVKGDN